MQEQIEPGGDGEQTDPTSWDLKDGDEIVPGRHAIKRLGGGNAYEAYLAWDDHMLALVVAKILRPHLVTDARSLKGLQAEAEMLERLSHPVIVRSFGSVLDGDSPHVVMEHLEAPHLARLIRRHGAMPLEQVLPLALQLCSALHYLAGEGIVHLDVKPRNIIMTAPPRLIDMSVARTHERAAKITGHVGTDRYMAPEQCDPSRGGIGAPADVWGLGATLFHSATGERPFFREDDFDPNDLDKRFPQLWDEPIPFPKKRVPIPLQETILACLQKDPSARPTAAEVAASLEDLVAGLPRKPVLGRLRPRMK
jgi:eukaryotic-like serine/threonine-protein kinase